MAFLGKSEFPLLRMLGVESKQINVVDRRSNESFVEKVYGDDVMKVFYGHPAGLAVTTKLLTNRVLSNIYGAYNDSAASKHKIEDFVEALGIDITECSKDLVEYVSFNDFFARKLRPGARVITEEDKAVASPGDGRLLVFPQIDDATVSYVKWAPISLFDLFNKNQELADRYRNGACAVLRLCPADYHRFHFPVAGKVGITKTVPGLLHSVSPYALEQGLPVYCLNKRTLCELKTNEMGTILQMEIGALFVGSIVQTYRAGTQVQRGDEKGYFKFGGSTCILFFEKGTVQFDDDLVRNSQNGLETLVKMGERLAMSLR
ncbi:MAG: phosphatidylserine decarboxylase [Betaproteobacteria bacterium]|nr:phosphatidylserine decarboxylase [Betaproteobacteria bacterium]